MQTRLDATALRLRLVFIEHGFFHERKLVTAGFPKLIAIDVIFAGK